jgi:hypothetical protein
MYESRRTDALSDFRILGLASKSEIIVQGRMASAQTIIEAAGIRRTHAYDILAGRQEPSLRVALDIFDATGERYGILRNLSDGAIAELRKQAA